MKNWSYEENATMKGYILYALALMGEAYHDHEHSENEIKMFLDAIAWAIDSKTVQKACEYY